MRRAGFPALWTIQLRGGMSLVNNQVAYVRNPSEGVGEDKNRIAIVKKAVT
jgi:hypothetical protein